MKKTHVHFMGIGGSALSGIAVIAKKEGYEVDGCNLEEDTAYLKIVKDAGIKVFTGHDQSHLAGVDILAVSPSVVYLNKSHQEFKLGKRRGILKIWDQFVGEHVLVDKEVICVTGTHGKSTTTTMAALLFEKAGLNPSALIGAKVREWKSNYRIGKSKYFIIEADDFYEKFLSFAPSTIILNNIEFDHPDFFNSEEHMVNSYAKFVRLLRGPKNLIINQDSYGNKKLIDKLGKEFLDTINIYGYSLTGKPYFELERSLKGEILETIESRTRFVARSKILKMAEEYELSIPGIHNVSNALGVVFLGKIYKIGNKFIKKTFESFQGTGRRFELVGESHGIVVYDDYAHHPTAIAATLEALRQKYPKSFVWAIDEPHMYSRTKALLPKYKGVFDKADRVIIAPIYKSRDKSTFGITPASIVKSSGHKNIESSSSFDDIVKRVKKDSREGDVILVMGAGDSYLLAQNIYKAI